MNARDADALIVGAGAAGLATAIFAARRCPQARIVALDGARAVGAKILVSGGGRCNVTNESVSAADYWGGSRAAIRRVLSALPAAETVAFFREIGVRLHAEPGGKLFPDTNRARTVLEALLRECARTGVEIRCSHRVTSVRRAGGASPDGGARGGNDGPGAGDQAGGPRRGFVVVTSQGELAARRVVLATGGLSLPKTGSDGGGYVLAAALGHTLVERTPALVPLLLEGDFHAPLAGVSQEAELSVHLDGRRAHALRGAMLWTHFGVSGPVVLDASRHWHRATLEGRAVELRCSLLPGLDFSAAERWLLEAAGRQPRAQLVGLLAQRVPARVAAALAAAAGVPGETPMAHLARESRRRLLRALLDRPLPVRGSRGYGYAEVTAGGVPLEEVDPATMASRKCPGLFLVGEILDVDGRLGGFNFQWAWSTGKAAGEGIAASFRDQSAPAWRGCPRS